MKKLLMILVLALSATSINAQTGKANLVDIAPVLFDAVSNNNPLLIENIIPEPSGDNHDMLQGQVSSAYGNLVKQGVNFTVPAASTTETVLYNEGSQERAIIKYMSASNGVNYTISARCAKINSHWFIISDIMPANQSIQN